MCSTRSPSRRVGSPHAHSRADSGAVRRTAEQWHIIVEGVDVPPPIKTFKEMKFPDPILNELKNRSIARPTPIQIQGLPVILSGRDIIGSFVPRVPGRSLTFILPMIMAALMEERRMPLEGGEGPVGLILCPSRELARQTHEVIEGFTVELQKQGMGEMRIMLCGGAELISRAVGCRSEQGRAHGNGDARSPQGSAASQTDEPGHL